jgi:hypothetical protein
MVLPVLDGEGGGDRAFADGGGDTFERTVTDLAGREDAGHAGFHLRGAAADRSMNTMKAGVAAGGHVYDPCMSRLS